jgi:hypothetical protein
MPSARSAKSAARKRLQTDNTQINLQHVPGFLAAEDEENQYAVCRVWRDWFTIQAVRTVFLGVLPQPRMPAEALEVAQTHLQKAANAKGSEAVYGQYRDCAVGVRRAVTGCHEIRRSRWFRMCDLLRIGIDGESTGVAMWAQLPSRVRCITQRKGYQRCMPKLPSSAPAWS